MTAPEQGNISERAEALREYVVTMIKSGFTLEKIYANLAAFGIEGDAANEIIRDVRQEFRRPTTLKTGDRLKVGESQRRTGRTLMFWGGLIGGMSALIRISGVTGSGPEMAVVGLITTVVAVCGGAVAFIGFVQWVSAE